MAAAVPDEDAPASRASRRSLNRAAEMREGPIVATLLRLSLPNLLALSVTSLVAIAETAYVGALGIAELGGIALIFPFLMLMQMLSAGALGGTVSGAISRALGAGDRDRAQALALSALAIGLGLGLTFSLLLWLGGGAAFHAMGGRGAVLAAALAYSHVAVWSIVAVWITNMLASILRGMGSMTAPAVTMLIAGLAQIVVGGIAGLGLGPVPRLGMTGVALGQLAAFVCSALVLFLYLRRPGHALHLRFAPGLVSVARIQDIMRVGAIAMLSPLQSVATILIITTLVARFGTDALAGYGIGVRLEFLLIPIAFSVGVACVPMVGTAIGAGNVDRARRIAWSGGLMAAAALGAVGVIFMAAPWLWVDIFTDSPAVHDAAATYLRTAGYGFPFFGLGLCLYFSAQGAGRVGGPIVAQGVRLALVAGGGVVLAQMNAPLWTLFALSALAMGAMGLGTALAVRLARW